MTNEQVVREGGGNFSMDKFLEAAEKVRREIYKDDEEERNKEIEREREEENRSWKGLIGG